MLRKLLTLLAICAGLAGGADRGCAAVTGVESVHMVVRPGSAIAARVAAHPAARLSPAERVGERAEAQAGAGYDLIVPTVMLKVDRARE